MNGSRDGILRPDAGDDRVDAVSRSSALHGFHLAAMPGLEDLVPGAGHEADAAEGMARLVEEAGHLRAALARAYQRIAALENVADQDSLVPAYNRRAFMRELASAISYAERYGTPASVAYFDINGMKQVNDTFGHGAGDAVLHSVAELLSANVRRSDVVGRLGGDEFGIILRQAGAAAAERKAAELAGMIAATPINWERSVIRLTAARGVHTLRGGDTPLAALCAADRAMYGEKASQRGREQLCDDIGQ